MNSHSVVEYVFELLQAFQYIKISFVVHNDIAPLQVAAVKRLGVYPET